MKTPSGDIQQSPWLPVANKQLERMGRYMAEPGSAPASRSRVVLQGAGPGQLPTEIIVRAVYSDRPDDGT